MKPIAVLALCIYLVACSNPKENAIAEFVETSGNVRTDMDIRVHELKQAGWITGKDSLELVQEEIRLQKLKVFEHLESVNRQQSKVLSAMERNVDVADSDGYKNLTRIEAELENEARETMSKMDAGGKGVNPLLDSLLALESLYLANPENKLLPIYNCKYSFTNQGQKSTATVKFVFSKDESKVLAQL